MAIANEIWKDIEGYERLYQISNTGRVKSLDRNVNGIGRNQFDKEHILKQKKDKDGYYGVGLCKNNKRKYFRVHRLVALAFIPNPDNLPFINHKNEIRDDNRVENLEWCTAKYNSNYGSRVKKFVEKRSMSVTQYTLDGEQIATYPSASEAARQNGFTQGGISCCCRGHRKQMYGYLWRYA